MDLQTIEQIFKQEQKMAYKIIQECREQYNRLQPWDDKLERSKDLNNPGRQPNISYGKEFFGGMTKFKIIHYELESGLHVYEYAGDVVFERVILSKACEQFDRIDQNSIDVQRLQLEEYIPEGVPYLKMLPYGESAREGYKIEYRINYQMSLTVGEYTPNTAIGGQWQNEEKRGKNVISGGCNGHGEMIFGDGEVSSMFDAGMKMIEELKPASSEEKKALQRKWQELNYMLDIVRQNREEQDPEIGKILGVLNDIKGFEERIWTLECEINNGLNQKPIEHDRMDMGEK